MRNFQMLIVSTVLLHQRLNFDGFIYVHHAAPPYSAGAVITASVYGVGLVKIQALFFRQLA